MSYYCIVKEIPGEEMFTSEFEFSCRVELWWHLSLCITELVTYHLEIGCFEIGGAVY